MKKINTFVLMCFVSVLMAQDISPTKVTVIEGFKPQIPESEKIKETTQFSDTTKIDKTQKYSFVEKTLNTDYEISPLNPARVSGEKLSDLYRSTILLGGGTHFTSVSNITFNSLREDDYSYGLTFNHLSNKYSDKNSEKLKNSLNQVHLFGKKIEEKNIYLVNLDYDRSSVENEYRLLPESVTNTDKNRFSYSKIGSTIFSKELSEDKLKYYTNFFISDLNKFSENQIHLTTALSKDVNGYPVQLEIEFDNFINYANSELDDVERSDLKIFALNSFISIEKYDFDIDLGFSSDYILDDLNGSEIGLFPYINISKFLVKDILYIEGGLENNGYRNTIKSLSDDNPYIYAFATNQDVVFDDFNTLDLRTTEENEAYLYTKNVLGKDEVFEGRLSYAYIVNAPIFYKVPYYLNGKYLSSYIDVWRLHTNANYEWQINDLVGVHASANYFNYDTIVSNKENINGNLGVSLNLDEKIKMNTSVSYLGKRKSVGGLQDSLQNYHINYNDIFDLSHQLHANISIDYNYTKSISAYLRINNIFNSKQDMWERYQEIGRNAWFGLSYSF
ncbi:MAG: hypothetical protein P8H17_05780 [Flavobacteriales bacterium]|nr:hypothetical protein [Flavobacteriales bacterium]